MEILLVLAALSVLALYAYLTHKARQAFRTSITDNSAELITLRRKYLSVGVRGGDNTERWYKEQRKLIRKAFGKLSRDKVNNWMEEIDKILDEVEAGTSVKHADKAHEADFRIPTLNDKKPPKRGVSVVRFAKTVQQPHGGFISARRMVRSDQSPLPVIDRTNEDIQASLVGLTVDYMTRYLLTSNEEEAFAISLMAAHLADRSHAAKELLDQVRGLDHESVTAACRLAGYDVVLRSGIGSYVPVEKIQPSPACLDNMIELIRRSVEFFKKQKVIACSVHFMGGFTSEISTGDADYLCEDTIWDLKVLSGYPTKVHTMQLITYKILLDRTPKYDGLNVHKIGIYNPRQDVSYTFDLNRMSAEDWAHIMKLTGADDKASA